MRKRKGTKTEKENPLVIVNIDHFEILNNKETKTYFVEYWINCKNSNQTWTIKKRYFDFCQLHANLISNLGNSFYEKINFPTQIFHGHLDYSLKREIMLHNYLFSILKSEFCNNLFIEIFLDLRKYVVSKEIKFEINRKDEIYKINYNYKTNDEEEIELIKDKEIFVLDKDFESGWWYGHLKYKSDSVGFFPSNYIQIISENEIIKNEDILDIDAPNEIDEFMEKYNRKSYEDNILSYVQDIESLKEILNKEKLKITQLNNKTIVIRISKRRSLKRLPRNENKEKDEIFELFGEHEIPNEWIEIFEKAGLSKEEMKNPKILKYIMKKVKKFLKPIDSNIVSDPQIKNIPKKSIPPPKQKLSINKVEMKQVEKNDQPPWLIELKNRKKK
eukprot:gene4214-7551_t